MDPHVRPAVHSADCQVGAGIVAPGTDSHERRVSPAGQVYYWARGHALEFTHTAPDTDVEALFERCVTVTPLTYILTDYARLQTWKDRLEN